MLTGRRPLALPRLFAAGAGLVALLAGGVVAAAPAQAAACSGTTGVTVVVDFGSAGGGVSVGCAKGSPSSGLSALTAAGFSVTQVQTQPGFVCRISGKPASQTCVRTPPASAYWSYWHAPRGGGWSYSQVGAGSYRPKPGTVEGWAFGSGGKPGVSPPARATPVRPAKPAPKPVAQPVAKPRPATSTAPPSPGRGTGPQPVTGGVPALTPTRLPGVSVTAGAPATPGAPSSAPSALSSSPGASPSGAAAPDVAAAPVRADTERAADQSSGATGLLVGLGLLAVLAAAGTVLVRRRRHPFG